MGEGFYQHTNHHKYSSLRLETVAEQPHNSHSLSQFGTTLHQELLGTFGQLEITQTKSNRSKLQIYILTQHERNQMR